MSWRRAAATALLALIVAGCMPSPATGQARAVADLWTQFAVAAIAVGGLVWTLITVAILRYRRPRGDGPLPPRALPPQTTGSTRLEVIWTAGPIVIVAILFWLTIGALDRIDAHQPGGVTVDVSAFRWQWRFDYPGAGVSVTGGPGQPAEMVVPFGEPIHIVLTSNDVDHAFYVPAFLFKRDAIPGRTSEFDVTIAEAGTYRGQCAEFCGVFHDRMLLSVRAVSRADFDAWIASQRRGGSASPVPAPSRSGGP